jgi:hypothetical protein
MTKDIKATSREDLLKINRLATDVPYSVWVHGKDILLDAKSLMGLFLLSPDDSLKVVVPDDVDSRRLFSDLDRALAH